jgi:hypothetical protein
MPVIVNLQKGGWGQDAQQQIAAVFWNQVQDINIVVSSEQKHYPNFLPGELL